VGSNPSECHLRIGTLGFSELVTDAAPSCAAAIVDFMTLFLCATRTGVPRRLVYSQA